MVDLLVATFNEGKLREISKELEGAARVINPRQLGFTEAPPERGSTFRENALEKAMFFSSRVDFPVFAEDSGLVVPYLNGEPGIYSARYSGSRDPEANIRYLLEKMSEAEGKDRRAKFVAFGVVVCREKILWERQEEVWGEILKERRGRGGFGYDPVFFYPPLGKTFAELSLEEKNRVSHRGRLIRALREFLLSFEGRDFCGELK